MSEVGAFLLQIIIMHSFAISSQYKKHTSLYNYTFIATEFKIKIMGFLSIKEKL